jgi:hypothetical protein
MARPGWTSGMAVATETMQQQHGIVGGAIELAPAFPGQGEGTEAAPQFQLQGLVAKELAELALAAGIARSPAAMAVDAGGGGLQANGEGFHG